MEEKIKELKRRIENYVAAGGDIYAPKRELPYYDYMGSIIKWFKKNKDEDVSYADLYKLCGIDFDREYKEFKTFQNLVRPLTKNFNADSIKDKKVRENIKAYDKLKVLAERYKTTPFDFLTLMMGYSFSECNIKTDNYEECLKYLLLQKFPDRNLDGIRHNCSDLYEQLRQLQHYYPHPISMKTLTEKMGFEMPKASGELPMQKNKHEILAELLRLYPKRKIEKLTQNGTLYYQVVKIARSEGKSAESWLMDNGFLYSGGINIDPLSQIKVDADKRRNLLIWLKKEQLEKMKIRPKTEVELYRASLEASLAVIEFINKTKTVDILKLADALEKESKEESKELTEE